MKQHQSEKGFLFLNFALIVLVFVWAQVAFGQTQTTTPERGFNPGRSYSISDIETIGLYSGNMMLNLPVGALPPGRGGTSATVNLHYNSKIWETRVLERYEAVSTHDVHTLFQSDEGGWRYGYKYRLELDYRLMGPDQGFCMSGFPHSYYPYKLQLVLPDGSRHGLYADGYMNPALSSGGNDPTPHPEGEFMRIWPDGRPACTTENPPYSTTPVTGTITYFTDDGTFLRVEMETDSDSDWQNNRWTLYMPDGGRVIYNPGGGVSQRIIDRNGNSIDIIENASDPNYSGHKTTYLKDDLDRKVVIEYAYSTDMQNGTTEDRIHSKGFDGEDVITRVIWKKIIVNRTYARCEYNPPGSPIDNQNFPLNQMIDVVHRVYLPTQIGEDLFYEFDYNADSTTAADYGWGEVNKVKLPSGAWAEYDYYYDDFSGSLAAESVLLNRPVEKRLKYNVEYDGATPQQVTQTWTYTPIMTYNALENLTGVTVTGPDGGQTTEHYAQVPESVFTPPALPDYVVGEVYKSEMPDGSVVERFYQSNVPVGSYPTQLNKANRFVKYEFTSLRDAAGNLTKTAIKEYSRDKNGNVTEVKEYDFVSYSSIPRNSLGRVYTLPSGITPARITKTAYYNDTPDSTSTTFTDPDSYYLAGNPRLLGLVKSTEIQDGSGNPKSRTEIYYDHTSYSGSNTKGGNPIETRSWDSTKQATLQEADSNGYKLVNSNYISSLVSYDAYGNPTQTTDANGVQTTITYGCIDGQIFCAANMKDLYPTRTETASNYPSVKRTSTAQYDFYTGLVTLETDVDNNVSTATEYDALGRAVKVAAAVGTPLEVWTQTVYDDVDRRVIIKSDLETKGDAKKVAIRHYDQLGRIRLSRTLEDAATEDPLDEKDGIKVQTRYMISGGYTYQLVSNPYRANYSSGATNEPEMGWTLSSTHYNGKHSEVETFSGAALPAPWGSNSNTTGKVQTDIDADRTLVTDQAGKQRLSRTNALGQLTDVWEITAADSATEAVSFYTNQQLNLNGYRTSYQYDTLGNLTLVTQGAQTRTFSYSSLSRLLSANNPESGLIQYQYDNNGNLTRKTDARGVVTTYVYDALNRVTNRNYSNEPGGQTPTPNVTYYYDGVYYDASNQQQTATGAVKGKLTSVSSSISRTNYTAFDAVGRVLSSQQITAGKAYDQTYTYNLSGALIEQTYPSGRKVKNVLDSNGDLSIVQSKKNADSGYWNYARHFTYTAAGAVTSMQLGNFRWESTQFNSRLQPVQIALGTTQEATDLLKLDHDYGTTSNNGNVLSQTITVPAVGANTGFTAVQTYTYDSLNRLKSAVENLTPQGGSSVETWKQTFTYDRYGNRNFDEANTTTLPKECTESGNPVVCQAIRPVVNPSIDDSNNRLSTSDGYTFDASGNTTKDAQNRKFTYDAENKQVKVESLDEYGNPISTIGEYFYDGDGKRVKKVVPSTGETTVFVYDASGKLAAEYSTIVETQNPKVSYLTADHLGSPRITTDENGQVISRRDFQPFGEEIATSQRTQGLGYAGDTVRQKFTGYERDNETDLDYAKARMYKYSHGRFTAPDPLLSSGRVENPQSWNRYTYVLNNPLLYIDPLGLYEWAETAGGSATDDELLERSRDKTLKKKERKLAKRQYEFRQRFRAGLERAKEAATSNRLTAQQQQQVQESVDSYGSENDDNGVFIGIRNNTRGAKATARLKEDDTISVNFNINLKGDQLAVTIAHEGRHVADAQTWVNAGHPTGGDTDMNHYFREQRAWNISSYVGQGLNLKKVSAGSDNSGKSYKVWSRGWKAAEIETKRANGIDNILTYSNLKPTDTDTYSNEHKHRP
jgi:RHS repeat-associated protein